MSSAQPNGGPDWTAIGGGLAVIATAVAGILAGVHGVFKREKTGVANPEQTLENVWRLVNELQEERNRTSALLLDTQTRCDERHSALLVTIAMNDAELRRHRNEVDALNTEIRSLRARMEGSP